jgi:hypothetical protein
MIQCYGCQRKQPPLLPLCDADLLGGLLLGDQFVLGLLQGHQPVSLSLGHRSPLQFAV